jgi:hypothetical protein
MKNESGHSALGDATWQSSATTVRSCFLEIEPFRYHDCLETFLKGNAVLWRDAGVLGRVLAPLIAQILSDFHSTYDEAFWNELRRRELLIPIGPRIHVSGTAAVTANA